MLDKSHDVGERSGGIGRILERKGDVSGNGHIVQVLGEFDGQSVLPKNSGRDYLSLIAAAPQILEREHRIDRIAQIEIPGLPAAACLDGLRRHHNPRAHSLLRDREGGCHGLRGIERIGEAHRDGVVTGCTCAVRLGLECQRGFVSGLREYIFLGQILCPQILERHFLRTVGIGERNSYGTALGGYREGCLRNIDIEARRVLRIGESGRYRLGGIHRIVKIDGCRTGAHFRRKIGREGGRQYPAAVMSQRTAVGQSFGTVDRKRYGVRTVQIVDGQRRGATARSGSDTALRQAHRIVVRELSE